MTTAIIDYGSGNLRSAAKAFARAAADIGKGDVIVTSAAKDIARADRIVLPGVGAFADCRKGLDAVPGMVEALQKVVIEQQRPFLGICVGMQLMADTGFEHGETQGLGWISGNVVELKPHGIAPEGGAFRVPHMGWNELIFDGVAHPLFTGFSNGDHMYFVHSYHLECAVPTQRLAAVNYGQSVTAAVGRDNIVGTQFHPEKSQALGLRLISNFLSWSP
jgi:glutamine amidotransferase